MSEALFERELRKVVDEEVAELSHQLGLGMAKDYADYKERCGVIKGLQSITDKIQFVREKLYGKEKDKSS